MACGVLRALVMATPLDGLRRNLHLDVPIDDVLDVRKFTANDGLSALFTVDVEVRCHNPALDLEELDMKPERRAWFIAATAAPVHHDRSILLIDRPEQSAGERSIAAWVEGARQLGKDTQLLLASASPALLASVDPAAILDLGG